MAKKRKFQEPERYYFDFFKKIDGFSESQHPNYRIDFYKFIQALDCDITPKMSRCSAESDWCRVSYSRDGNRFRIFVTTSEDIWKRLEDAGAIETIDTIQQRQDSMRQVINISNAMYCTFIINNK